MKNEVKLIKTKLGLLKLAEFCGKPPYLKHGVRL
jgi:hypothetical protein